MAATTTRRTALGVTVMLLLVAVPTFAATAAASGPPVLGGESEITYLGKSGFDLRMLPPGRMASLSVRAFWSCPSQPRYSRTKYFVANGKTVSSVDSLHRLGARDSYDNGRWQLRFSADWTVVTGTFTARKGGCKTGTLRISARRMMPGHTWQFGALSGTTSQGLPISLVSGYAVRYNFIESYVKLVTVTVRLSCTDGSTTETTLRSVGEDRVIPNGSFVSELTPTGQKLRSYIPEEGTENYGFIDPARLSGPQASGTIVARTPSNNCSSDPEGAQPVTFTAGPPSG